MLDIFRLRLELCNLRLVCRRWQVIGHNRSLLFEQIFHLIFRGRLLCVKLAEKRRLFWCFNWRSGNRCWRWLWFSLSQRL
ncbi:hypothetical protein [Cognatishimia sp.]|uniref:hypothetical protein n=1 Tax=Cognatishimia sp. TaxID=2211648 RepID=UPI0035112C9F